MAYITKKIGDRYNQPTYYFECDDIADMADIPLLMVPMGSRCFVINEGARYALNSNQEWKLVEDDDDDNNTEEESVKDAVQYIPQTLTEDQKMQTRANLDLYRLENEYLIKDEQVEFSNGDANLDLHLLVGTKYYIIIDGYYGSGVCEYVWGGSGAGRYEYLRFNFEDEAIDCIISSGTLYYATRKPEYTPYEGVAAASIYQQVPKQVPIEYLPSVLQYTEQFLDLEEQNQVRKNLALPHYNKIYPINETLWDGYYHWGQGWRPQTDILSSWGGNGASKREEYCIISVDLVRYHGRICQQEATYESMVGLTGKGFLGNAALLPYTPAEWIIEEYSMSDCPIAVYWEYSNGEVVDFQIYEQTGSNSFDMFIYKTTGYPVTQYEPLDTNYLPKADAVADAAGDAPTAEEFNALLNALRNAGYLSWD